MESEVKEVENWELLGNQKISVMQVMILAKLGFEFLFTDGKIFFRRKRKALTPASN